MRLPRTAAGRVALTLAGAALLVLAVLAGFGDILRGQPGFAPGDAGAFDLAASLRAGWLDGVMKAVTSLGSGSVLLPLGTLVVIVLLFRGWRIEALALALAMVTTSLGIDLLKELVDRPRPAGRLVATASASFPSGHAANSVFYVFVATLAAVRPGVTTGRRLLLIGAGLLVTVIIGLSRVYLRAHYLSDVTAGWLFGCICFTFFAGLALLVLRLRNNSGT